MCRYVVIIIIIISSSIQSGDNDDRCISVAGGRLLVAEAEEADLELL